MTRTQVLIASADDRICEELGSLLGATVDFTVVGHASDASAALRLARETRPQMLLLDPALPGARSTEFVSLIREQTPDLRVVLIT